MLVGKCALSRQRRGAERRPIHHRESCRRTTSSPVTTYFTALAATVMLTGDSLRHYASSPEASSGSFCGACGSPMSYTGKTWPGSKPTSSSPRSTPASPSENQGTLGTGAERVAMAARRGRPPEGRLSRRTPSARHASTGSPRRTPGPILEVERYDRRWADESQECIPGLRRNDTECVDPPHHLPERSGRRTRLRELCLVLPARARR